MDGVLDILLSASFWAAAIRIATPYMFGVLGALLCERSGSSTSGSRASSPPARWRAG